MENSRLEQIKTFLEENPSDPFLNYALAIEWVGIGEVEKAKLQFLKLLNEHPEYSATYYHYGKLLLKEGQKEEAVKTYEAGIEIAVKNKETHAAAELRTALNEVLYEED